MYPKSIHPRVTKLLMKQASDTFFQPPLCISYQRLPVQSAGERLFGTESSPNRTPICLTWPKRKPLFISLCPRLCCCVGCGCPWQRCLCVPLGAVSFLPSGGFPREVETAGLNPLRLRGELYTRFLPSAGELSTLEALKTNGGKGTRAPYSWTAVGPFQDYTARQKGFQDHQSPFSCLNPIQVDFWLRCVFCRGLQSPKPVTVRAKSPPSLQNTALQ